MITAAASAVNRNLLTPYKKRHRKEHHHRGQRRRQHRQRDFLAAHLSRPVGVHPMFQMTIDVLQHHHRVVDNTRERQRQPAQHHGVDGASAEPQDHECGERRQRNG